VAHAQGEFSFYFAFDRIALIILLALISKLKTTIFVLVKPNIATNTRNRLSETHMEIVVHKTPTWIMGI
jgi:hypothetical protein